MRNFSPKLEKSFHIFKIDNSSFWVISSKNKQFFNETNA